MFIRVVLMDIKNPRDSASLQKLQPEEHQPARISPLPLTKAEARERRKERALIIASFLIPGSNPLLFCQLAQSTEFCHEY